MKTIINNKLAALLFGMLLITSTAFSQSNSGILTGAAADKSFKPNSISTNGNGNNTTQSPAQKNETTPLTLMGKTHFTQADKNKPEVFVYATPDANYGFVILKDGKTIFQQEQIQAGTDKSFIYFSKADAEKAGAFVLKQVTDGSTPAPINFNTWQQIQKTASSK